MAKKGDAPKTHKGSMATGDSIFLSSSSLLVKCDKCSTLQIVLRVKDRVNKSPL